MRRLHTTLLAVSALALTAGSLIAPAAHADVILNDFNVNLQNTPCGGCTQIPDVKLLTLGNGNTVVNQQVSGGSILGQNFTETGVIGLTGGQFTNGFSFGLPNPSITPFIPFGTQLFFVLNNVSGHVNGDGSVTFNAASNALSLVWGPQQAINPTSPTFAGTTLATFDLASVTTDSLFHLQPNGVPSGSIGLVLSVNTVLPGPLFTAPGGAPLDHIVLELANIQPSLANLPNNPDFSLVVGGNGIERIFLTDQAQVQLTQPTRVPEPATLAVVGAGLIGAAFLRRRKKVRHS